MQRQFKVTAFLTFSLALLFYLFFQASKHNLTLSQVNAFAEDPYDAVSSFGTQAALLIALLSLIRAFRPYQSGEALDTQELLLTRGVYFSCLSVAVSLIADIIAMIRHPSIWMSEPVGYILAGLVGGMTLLTVLLCWFVRSIIPYTRFPSPRNAWKRSAIISVVSILLLIFYPETWRASVPGELFTVLFGTAFLFVLVWAIGTAIIPYPETFFEDFLDDLAAIYRWLKTHISPLAIFCTLLEKIAGWPPTRSVLDWLNPRQHTWNLAILLGIVMGILLAFAETRSEGRGSQQIGRLIMFASIFVSLESVGILLGYLFLAKPMGLFRQASPIKDS